MQNSRENEVLGEAEEEIIYDRSAMECPMVGRRRPTPSKTAVYSDPNLSRISSYPSLSLKKTVNVETNLLVVWW